MNKFLFMLVAMITMFVSSANAQITTKGASFGDNWFVGVNAGAVSPLNHSFDWANHGLQGYRMEYGVEAGKWITPVVGLGATYTAQVNTTGSKTAFDMGTALADVHFNLTNLFVGYKGEPRTWEFEVIPSVGFAHYFGDITYNPEYRFFAMSRVALSADYNFGKAKEWTVYVRPGIQYVDRIRDNNGQFDVRIGITYKFKGTKSKSHNFVACPYTITQSDYDAKVEELNTTINSLKKALSQKPTIVEVVKNREFTKSINNSYTVLFEQGKSNVGDITAIAEAINTSTGTITIVGGTSPEGTEDFNKNLAIDRANAVKNALINAGVDASRITVSTNYSAQRKATIVIK